MPAHKGPAPDLNAARAPLSALDLSPMAPPPDLDPDGDRRGRMAADRAADPKEDTGPPDLGWLTGGAWFAGEPPARDWLVYAADGQGGLLSRGKVGILAATGGVGKTYALIGLAIALAMDQPWLGCFPVDRGPKRTGRVAVVLGEEDAAEIHRRIHTQSRAMGLDPEDVKVRLRSSLFLPGAGQSLALIGTDNPAREVSENTRSKQLRAWLERNGEEHGGFDAVLLDPLSRFGGADMESDNAAATRVVEVLERFTQLPGGPAVLAAHHTTKGSTTGSDKAEGERTPFVRFDVIKSNYGPVGTRADLATVRDGGGILAAHARDVAGMTAPRPVTRGSSAIVDGARWVATLSPYYRTGAKAATGNAAADKAAADNAATTAPKPADNAAKRGVSRDDY